MDDEALMLEKDSIQKVINSIRKERAGRRRIPGEVNEALAELKWKEPATDNPFFRLVIIGYELQKAFGSLEHAIVCAERFRNDPEMRQAHLKNAQVEIGDCFTQLQMLCLTYGFDIDETRLLGAKHLAERHEDFKVKGWCEVK